MNRKEYTFPDLIFVQEYLKGSALKLITDSGPREPGGKREREIRYLRPLDARFPEARIW